MRLPFIDRRGFERLPGEKPICVGVFKANNMIDLLKIKERKVTGTAARFLHVSETEIIQIVPMSAHVVSIFFGEKDTEFDYGDEDEN